jgi:hypothetical protein
MTSPRIFRKIFRRARRSRPSGFVDTWRLMVPLNLAAIPPAEIEAACSRASLSLESWQRQEPAFGLLRKVYEQRCNIRAQQPVTISMPVMSSYDLQIESAEVVTPFGQRHETVETHNARLRYRWCFALARSSRAEAICSRRFGSERFAVFHVVFDIPHRMQADCSVWPSAINLQIRCNRSGVATRFRPTRACA